MANIKVFVVQRWRRSKQHPGDDNNSNFLQTAELIGKMFLMNIVCKYEQNLWRTDSVMATIKVFCGTTTATTQTTPGEDNNSTHLRTADLIMEWSQLYEVSIVKFYLTNNASSWKTTQLGRIQTLARVATLPTIYLLYFSNRDLP